MIDDVQKKLIAAHALKEEIINSVFKYVADDDAKVGFGVHAAVQASISLIKDSSMSSQTRMALAQSIFMNLTDDIAIPDIPFSENRH